MAASIREDCAVTPALLFPICRFIPESPRWLLSQNQKSKAVEITEKMAKENKMTLSKNIEVSREQLPVSGETRTYVTRVCSCLKG